MTEVEAIEVIRQEVEADGGFMAQVERTGEIAAEHVQSFYNALDTLSAIWRDRPDLPKRGLLPLVDLPSRIYAAAVAHEAASEEIEELGVEVYARIGHVFGDPPDPHTEEGAGRIIEEQFSSTAGIPYTLYMRLGYNPGLLTEALMALHTLEEAWRERDTVPRRLAEVMVDIRYAVSSTAGLYPERQTEIEEIANMLGAAVVKCLR